MSKIDRGDFQNENRPYFISNVLSLIYPYYLPLSPSFTLEAIIDADIRQTAPIKKVYSQWKFSPVSVTKEHLFITQDTNVHTKT